MAWIDAEYADEVAVLTTWLGAVLPWSVSSVSYAGAAPVESLLFFFRFPLFELQARLPGEVTVDGQVVDAGIPAMLSAEYGGIGLFGNVYLVVPPFRLGDVSGLASAAVALWTIAAVVMAGMVILSVAMYRREDAVRARLPIDYVRLTSVGFGVLTVLLGGATVALALADAPYGRPVPIGVVLLAAFAVVLWRAERVGDEA